MIERHWGCVTKPAMAEGYIKYLRQETFPKLEKLAGFKRATILVRSAGDSAQFLIVTTWENEDAVRAFAGNDPERAVVPEVVASMMESFDERASHFNYAD